ncbi:MAG: SGNH/GDSL hydrolase family protein [Clostridia bacterium]|nr:SGNH/GDSL hydrolase family protein [Clostridia bacterium]
MELEGKKAVFLGDSITQGVGVSDPQNYYFNRLKVLGDLAEVKGYGISGTRIARQQTPSDADCDRDFCMRVDELDEDADIVVVFGCTNDFGHGDAPIGTPEDRTPDTFWGACHYLMNRLQERFCCKTIVFMTPLHRCNEDEPKQIPTGLDVPVTLETYNQILKTVAAWYALPVLDLRAVSGIQPRVRIVAETLCPDGLHPNDAGHALIADRLFGFLKSL